MNPEKSIQQVVREAAETGESYGQFVARTELDRIQARYAEARLKRRRKAAARARADADPSHGLKPQRKHQWAGPEFKALVVQEIEDGVPGAVVSDKYGVPLNTIRKWTLQARREAGVPPRPGNWRRGHRDIDPEVKAQAMSAVLDRGLTIKAAAAENGVSTNALSGWLRAARGGDAEEEE